ncbi:MAG: ABC transporter permease [Parasporobacterium sp.]|nr:ABC transporter permease [Parasporobacterium sp.]
MENISLAFQGIWGHKLRSFLTMLGIIIGIASIIAIVSTISGTNEMIKKNLIGSGTDAVKIELYENDYPMDLSYQETPSGVQPITEETRIAVEKLADVKFASLYNSRTYAESLYWKDVQISGTVYGIDMNYFKVYNYSVTYGRNFNDDDYDKSRKTVILDDVAVANVFDGKNPLGETIEIKGEPFTIVGVVSQKTDFKPTINNLNDYYTYNQNSTGKIFVTSSAWPIIYKFDEPQNMAIKAASTDVMSTAGKAAADLITKRHISSKSTQGGSEYSYKSEDLLGQAKELQELSNSTNQQLIWIAGISLLVGGIGVMNIMLVSVTERTAEIGLKKAIGAKKRRILWQFLTEAAVLTSMGGIIGVLVGIGLAFLLSSLTSTPVALNLPAIIIAVAFSMVIGIVFGLVPAMKASKLNPIDALRHV